MQAFNLNTSLKIADSNLIAMPHRCQPFSTGETHLKSLESHGIRYGSSNAGFVIARDFLSRSLSVPLIAIRLLDLLVQSLDRSL